MKQLLSAQTPLLCHITCHNAGAHLNQIFTGLTLLHSKGIIRLTQSFVDKKRFATILGKFKNPEQIPRESLLLVINNQIKVFYDTMDSNHVNSGVVAGVDFYFKRSYEPEYLNSIIKCELRRKIFPLGFNYGVILNNLDFFKIRRDFYFRPQFISKLRSLISNIGITRTFQPKIKFLQQNPEDWQAPRILFIVRAWDPYHAPDQSSDEIHQNMAINETRAECIALLREKLKQTFFGGFAHTPYAQKKYKNLLLTDNRLSEKSRYNKLLKKFSICVATKGLQGSVGWKMGEYIAHSKAILSEKFNVAVPGDFSEGQNYLSFANPKEALDQAQYFIESPEIRKRIMDNNFDYYRNYLHPEVLMLNSLNTVLIHHESGKTKQ